jgi:hypothetical protein
MDPRTHVISKGVSALVWIALGLCVFVIATDKRHYEWDFRIFHSAPTALHTGDNPYDGANPRFHYPEQMPFLYPPVTLYAFEPLSKVSDRTARLAWLAAKLLALGCLALLWHRHFEPLNFSFPVVLFLALGYNAALLRDLAAGNISIFEQLGIWFGFYLLVRNRPYLAGLVLAATAQFKLVPAVLLGTLLFVGPAGRWKPFAASVAAFGALFSLNFLLTPQLMEEYMGALAGGSPNLDERGESAPSALALIRDVAEDAASWGVRVSHSGADLAYLTYAGVFALVLLRLAWKHRAALASRDPRWVIYCSCVVYVLIVPRVKDYSYILLLMPSLYLIRRIDFSKLRPTSLIPVLGVLMFVPAKDSYVPGLQTLLPWLESYLPWLVAWCLLYYLVRMPLESRAPEKVNQVKAAEVAGELEEVTALAYSNVRWRNP